MERPISELSNNNITAPIPELIFRHMGIGLIPLFEKVDEDGYYLGKSFQTYTGYVLRHMKSSIKLYSNNDLEKKSIGEKSCDFLLITNNENVLLECKAIDFRVRTLTENAIIKSGATAKIKQSIKQIFHTYENIMSGKLYLNDVDKSKPFVGVVVTLGEMPGFNSKWFFDNILKNDIDTQNDTLKRLVILSIDSLERLIVYLNSTEDFFVDIYDHKMEKGYVLTGDWDVFLMDKISELKSIQNLDYVDKVVNEVYKNLGIRSDLY